MTLEPTNHEFPKHIHRDSIPALSMETSSSVGRAAMAIQEEAIHMYGLYALQIRLAMYKNYDIPLPTDVNNLLSTPSRYGTPDRFYK